jgi:DnaD/phage-associated family protein
MSKKKPAPSIVPSVVTASGFTPCPDVLVDLYGSTTATVWGKIWRYSQMADGVCKASVLRLADELNMSANTFSKHAQILEVNGYIEDTTPDVRNKPHVYVDTGKLRIKISLEMSEIGGTQKLSSRYAKIEHEESTTKVLRAKTKIFAAYEENIGALTAIMAETLIDAENEYPESWVLDAISIAVQNEKRNWRYCETILKRWKSNGKDAGKGKPKITIDEALRKAGYDA